MHQPATGTKRDGGQGVQIGDRFPPQGLGGFKAEEETLH